MSRTYKAVQATKAGTLELVERPIIEPSFGQVRIRVEACGICHTDAATVTGTYPGLKLPRVPGHEVVGRIEALGAAVSRWKIGQRVKTGVRTVQTRRHCELSEPSGIGSNRGWRICGSDDR